MSFEYYRKASSKTHAFTLIEMLIVILIIAILAAMIAPSLRNSLLNAKQLVCQNNQKQMFYAVLRYVDDNAGYIIPFTGTAYIEDLGYGTRTNFGISYYCATGYLNRGSSPSSSVICCPLAYEQANSVGYGEEALVRGTYAVSAMISYYYYPGTSYYSGASGCIPKRLSSLGSPSKHFYASEKICVSNYTGDTRGIKTNLEEMWPIVPVSNGGISYIHNGGANFMFLDGHVKYISLCDVSSPPPFNTPSSYIYPW